MFSFTTGFTYWPLVFLFWKMECSSPFFSSPLILIISQSHWCTLMHFAHWWGLVHVVFFLTDATVYLWIVTSCYFKSFPCSFRNGMGRLTWLRYIQAIVLIFCLIFFFIPLINVHKYIWGFLCITELSFHRNFLHHSPFSSWW